MRFVASDVFGDGFLWPVDFLQQSMHIFVCAFGFGIVFQIHFGGVVPAMAAEDYGGQGASAFVIDVCRSAL